MFAVQSARPDDQCVRRGCGDLPGEYVCARSPARGTGEWPATPEDVAPAVTTVQDASLALGMDDAGNAYAAYTYTVARPRHVLRDRAATARPAAGSQSGDLSPATATSHGVLGHAAGEPVRDGRRSSGCRRLGARLERRRRGYGATTTNIWGATEDVNDAGAHHAPTAAIGDDGTVVAAWEQETTGGNKIGQARVQGAGGGRRLGRRQRQLTSPHANARRRRSRGRRSGDYATVSSAVRRHLPPRAAVVLRRGPAG